MPYFTDNVLYYNKIDISQENKIKINNTSKKWQH